MDGWTETGRSSLYVYQITSLDKAFKYNWFKKKNKRCMY
jgi:hypothetical protein